jgi:hypothetical protein
MTLSLVDPEDLTRTKLPKEFCSRAFLWYFNGNKSILVPEVNPGGPSPSFIAIQPSTGELHLSESPERTGLDDQTQNAAIGESR